MTNEITFSVRGIPAPGGSKRGFLNPRNGRVIITDDCKRSKPWQQLVNAAARDAHQGEPLDGPLRLEVEFTMPRPKSHFTKKGLRPTAPRHHTSKPDATKLLRSFEDALKGVVWLDDSQVAVQVASKFYGTTPGAVARVERLDDGEARALTCCGRSTR